MSENKKRKLEIECEVAGTGMDVVHSTNEEFIEIKEGLARISMDKDTTATFYNPVQEFNRDLTVTVLKEFVAEREAEKSEEGIHVLDALSASGLRALRFALEVPSVDCVVANDFSEEAVEAIRRNVEANGVQDKVKPTFSDAVELMMEHRKYKKRFHAVDLDPYGSASMFLDSAVQAVADGGILMVTCTDMAILCGNTPEACFNKYGSVPLRHKSCHEIALRILLRSIDSHANRYTRYITPLLSVSVDFYIRCFVKVRSGAAPAKDSVTKLAHVFCCATCQSLDFQPLVRKSVNGPSVKFSSGHFQSKLIRNDPSTSDGRGSGAQCAHCGGTAIHMGGPIWVAPIHDEDFVQKLRQRLRETPAEQRLGTHDRLEGVLAVVSEELHDVPLYYEHDQLMRIVKSPAIPIIGTISSALRKAGYRCSASHCNPRAIKTDAPLAQLWNICKQMATKIETASKFKAMLNKSSKQGVSQPEKEMLKKRSNSDPNPQPPKAQYPMTPEHYWDVNFPSQDEQIERGYLTITNSPLFKKQPTKRRIL